MLNADLSYFKKFDILVSSCNKTNSLGIVDHGENLQYMTASPILYDSFNNGKETYIVIPPHRKQEWEIFLENQNFTCIDNYLRWGQQVTFFYKKEETNKIANTSLNIIFATLFLNESNDTLNAFFDFYRSQGVQKFLMYYNGIISDRKQPLPNYKDVEYVEWNFPYWWWKNNEHFHYAQLSFLNTVVKKNMYTAKHIILADVDEYILPCGYPKYKNIAEYLDSLNFPKNLFTQHFYSSIDFQKRAILHENKTTHNFFLRGKTVINTLTLNPEDIIEIHQTKKALVDSSLKLFHNKPTINSYTSLTLF